MMSSLHYFIAVIAVLFAVFMNYPPPPESPILYQWRTDGGHYHYHGDFRIFYRSESGSGNSGTLLCLHGFPTSSFDWFKVWPGLKRLYKRVIAVDFLGFGFSDKPRYHHYTIKEQADIVLEILKVLEIRSVHILAHDYGDTVALELLARHLETPTIHSACLLNGGLFPKMHHPTLLQVILRIPVIGTVVSRFGNYLTFKLGFTKIFSPTKQPPSSELADIWHIIRLQDGYRVFGNILSYIDERVTHENRWVNELSTTKVPVHMIYGVKDPVNPPPFAEHYKTIVPNSTIDVLPDVGHYVQLEAPEDMLKYYDLFLSSLTVN